MKRMSILSIVLVVALLLSTIPTIAVAENVNEELPEVTSRPGTFMYGLNRAVERVQFALTFNSERRAELALRNAERRLAESKAMIEAGDNQSAVRLMEEYSRGVDVSQENLERARTQGRDVESLETHINERLTKHIQVLQEVKETAPDQAQFGLDTAIESSQRNVEETKRSIQSRIQERTMSRPINEMIVDIDVPVDVDRDVPVGGINTGITIEE